MIASGSAVTHDVKAGRIKAIIAVILTMVIWGTSAVFMRTTALALTPENSLLGTVLWNYGTRHLPGAAVGSFLYLLPVIGVGAGHFILSEPVTLWLVLGGSIILAGVALAQSGGEPSEALPGGGT
jgi:hypothetical protein